MQDFIKENEINIKVNNEEDNYRSKCYQQYISAALNKNKCEEIFHEILAK